MLKPVLEFPDFPLPGRYRAATRPLDHVLCNTRLFVWTPERYGITVHAQCPNCKATTNIESKGWAEKARIVKSASGTVTYMAFRRRTCNNTGKHGGKPFNYMDLQCDVLQQLTETQRRALPFTVIEGAATTTQASSMVVNLAAAGVPTANMADAFNQITQAEKIHHILQALQQHAKQGKQLTIQQSLQGARPRADTLSVDHVGETSFEPDYTINF